MDQLGGDKSGLSTTSGTGTSKQDDIVIHTMKDDLAIVKQEKLSRAETSQVSTGKKAESPVVDQVTSRKSENNASLPQQAKDSENNLPKPLPMAANQSPSSSQKVVMAPPNKSKKHSNWLLKSLVVILIIVIIGGAGAVGWKFILSDYFDDKIDTEVPVEVVEVEEVIPRDIVMMLSYKINSDQDARDIVNAWENTTDTTSSLTGLLEGDPRYLIENYSIDQMHYFLLDGGSEPYLLIPVTDQTTNLVDSLSVGAVLSRNGWYLLHSFDTDLYEQKIAEGVWASKQDASAEISLFDNKIGMVIGSNLLLNIRESWGNSSFSIGHMDELFVNGELLSQGTALSLEGVAESTKQPGEFSTVTDQRLLEIVPRDTSIVHLGANFVEDLYAWNDNANLLDSDVLNKPIVDRLLSDLNTPYAYYSRESQDGTNDIGIIIKIPGSLSNELTIGDESLEETLPALIPLIAQRSTDVEFTFADNTHEGLPLRYVNISGQKKALDYAITDDYILVSTSKEGMFTLIDTFNGDSSSLNTAEYWQTLLSQWGTIPQATDIVIGRIDDPSLTDMLPMASDDNELVFGFATGWTEELLMTVKGVLILDNEQISTTSERMDEEGSSEFLDIE